MPIADHRRARGFRRRLLWFAALWLAGVGAVTLAAALLKLAVNSVTP